MNQKTPSPTQFGRDRAPRSQRRLRVSYRRHAQLEREYVGYTTNISASGMFLATRFSLPRGSRLRVEVSSGDSSFIAEAVVARVVRTMPMLQGVPGAPVSGMGLRFLKPQELIAELIPEIGSTPNEERKPSAEGVYQVRFADREQLIGTYERDIKVGGLFVPTDHPGQLGERVTIQLIVNDSRIPPYRLHARVVQRFDPIAAGAQNAAENNILAGMGVVIEELATVQQQLMRLLEIC